MGKITVPRLPVPSSDNLLSIVEDGRLGRLETHVRAEGASKWR
jgi:hypothetical protein